MNFPFNWVKCHIFNTIIDIVVELMLNIIFVMNVYVTYFLLLILLILNSFRMLAKITLPNNYDAAPNKRIMDDVVKILTNAQPQ